MSDRQTPSSQEATRGEYRDDQHAGVDNSVQPTRGEPRCGGHGDLPLHGDVHAPGNRHIRIVAYGGPLAGEVITLAGRPSRFHVLESAGKRVQYRLELFIDPDFNRYYALVFQDSELPDPERVVADARGLGPQRAS